MLGTIVFQLCFSPQPPCCSGDGHKRCGSTWVLSTVSGYLQRTGFCLSCGAAPYPSLLGAMPASLCSVCGQFDLAFDFLRFWEPLPFLRVPTELTVCQGTEQVFCRVWVLFLAK